MHHDTAATVPCPRCEEPIRLPVSVTSVPFYPSERDLRRGSRFLVTVPVVTHRCPDLEPIPGEA